MSYHANVTMALHLVQDIMPHVWAQRPTAKVLIVGQNPPVSVQRLAEDPRISVTGYVSDMRPYLQQATVAVAPSVYGAGIQNKVLEAMACGAPVVAMERAIAALTLKPEQDLLVANDVHSFAKQVLRLLNDETLRQMIGLNGLKYVQQEHAWPNIGANLEKIYQTLVKTHPVT
jgi:glycosyltransferase involved in cell wall biosynthesis